MRFLISALVVLIGTGVSLQVPAQEISRKNPPQRASSQKETPYQGTKDSSSVVTQRREAAASAIRELRKIEAATKVGINRGKYGDRLIDAKASIEDSLTQIPNGELSSAIRQSLDAYEDAATLWNIASETSGMGFYLKRLAAHGIIERYHLNLKLGDDYLANVRDNKYWDDYVIVPVEKIWREASKFVGVATELSSNK